MENIRLYRIDYTDLEWFVTMKGYNENLPEEYCDIFDRDGEVSEEYADIMNVDVYVALQPLLDNLFVGTTPKDINFKIR